VKTIARLALLLSAVLTIAAQTQPAAETAYTGCVMSTEAGDWTFCEPNDCSLLQGKYVGAKLAGHRVTLHAAVQAATASTPRTLVVSSVVSIGAACSERCSLRPPGHRGLGGHEHPGSEGGTPGVAAPHPPMEN
jgi:hypothetical protein